MSRSPRTLPARYTFTKVWSRTISSYEPPPWPPPPAYRPFDTAAASQPAPAAFTVPWQYPEPPRPRKALIISVVVLGVALGSAIAAFAYYFVKLDEATVRIEQQDREIQEQHDLIEEKEVFGAAMTGLLDTAHKFDGVLLDSVVPFHRYDRYAGQAWVHRWNLELMKNDVVNVEKATTDLEDLLTKATAEAGTNLSGSTYEAVIDQLGGGFAISSIDDADSLCGDDVLACVLSNDPYVVHFDAADNSVPYMNDVLRTGIAYHEFAHVLQLANPDPTETALTAFGGDTETMADCFALTYLPGWKLNHRVWVSSYQYWDVSIGYGYTCDESQRQVIRDWYGQLGFHATEISQ